MDFNEFDKKLHDMAAKTKAEMPKLYGALAATGLRFVDDNFRAQAWEGKLWAKNARGGTVLVDKGTLKRSFDANVSNNQAEIFTNVPYAAAHNEGSHETVNVRAHHRNQFKKSGKKTTKVKTGEVRAHKRTMNLEQRQFAPTDSSKSATLDKEVTETIETFFKDILKPE